MTIEQIPDEFDVENEDETREPVPAGASNIQKPHKQAVDGVNRFLGNGLRSVESYEPWWYYRGLAAWSVKSYISASGWKIEAIQGFTKADPVYRDVHIDISESESCLADGQYLLEKEGVRLVITVWLAEPVYNFVQAEAGEAHKPVVKQLLSGMEDYQNTHNFYRGKKLSFDDEIDFLKTGHRGWDSVILDPVMKKEIRQNTVGFLKKCRQLERYGIPSRRGIILAGEPGTGKTTIFKALMSEAENITCINVDAYGLLNHISQVFEIAQDLSPTIIFVEDIDFIGQERQQHYRGTTAFLELLEEMDGISEKSAIVTIATSNNLESLDKALRERPSRFDRVFRITNPSREQRMEMIERMAEKIPLSETIKEYIANATNGYTPAQLQEVLHGMVIAQDNLEENTMDFTKSDVDTVIALINHKQSARIGFSLPSSS
jgi:cell division protease FtsH